MPISLPNYEMLNFVVTDVAGDGLRIPPHHSSSLLVVLERLRFGAMTKEELSCVFAENGLYAHDVFDGWEENNKT